MGPIPRFSGSMGDRVSGQLKNVRQGIDHDIPIKMCIFGGPGTGKTTLGSKIENSLLVDFEGGARHVSGNRIAIKTRKAFDELLSELEADGGKTYKVLVLDTVDWLQKAIFDDVAAQAGAPNIAAIEFGKGYAAAQQALYGYLDRLDGLMTKSKMDIVFLAHSQKAKTTDNPEQHEIDRHTIKLQVNDKGVGMGPILIEWVDYLLYATYDDTFYKDKGRTKAKAGDRVLRTTGHTYWQAKSRRPIKDVIPMNWEAFKTEHAEALIK